MSWRKFRGSRENLRVRSRFPRFSLSANLASGSARAVRQSVSYGPTSGFYGPSYVSLVLSAHAKRTRNKSAGPPRVLLRFAQTKLLPSGRRQVFILSIGSEKERQKRGGSERRGHNAALLRQGAVTVGVSKFPPWKNITFLLGGPNKCNSVTARSLSRLFSGSVSPRLSLLYPRSEIKIALPRSCLSNEIELLRFQHR